jgi:hypothetical protein
MQAVADFDLLHPINFLMQETAISDVTYPKHGRSPRTARVNPRGASGEIFPRRWRFVPECNRRWRKSHESWIGEKFHQSLEIIFAERAQIKRRVSNIIDLEL